MKSSTPAVQFQLQEADINAFQRFLSGNKGGFSTQRLLRTLFVLFLLMLVAGVAFRSQLPAGRPTIYAPRVQRASPWITMAPLLLPLMMFPVFYFIAVTSNKKARQNNPNLVHPSTVTMSPGDVRLEVGATTTQMRWDGILRVENTPSHLFFFTQPNNGFIVPRRAFNSDEEFEQFCGFARQKSEAAKPPAPQTPPIAQV